MSTVQHGNTIISRLKSLLPAQKAFVNAKHDTAVAIATLHIWRRARGSVSTNNSHGNVATNATQVGSINVSAPDPLLATAKYAIVPTIATRQIPQ
ncbi:hypothetical protein [Nocardia iowensis]|uniref:Uncharacterized protein n=1 Tax=Nocardia iowensis TaxID=204891 RepID=A0ABX8RFV3_NOCIO|nr:hypothetical protein [Nocardia iowensis]QXN88488.1 hypothetical protein KV110_23105 [Nocardia iowensis]